MALFRALDLTKDGALDKRDLDSLMELSRHPLVVRRRSRGEEQCERDRGRLRRDPEGVDSIEQTMDLGDNAPVED